MALVCHSNDPFFRPAIQARQILNLYNNSAGKINKAYKFGPTINVIYFILTDTPFRAIRAGLHEAEEKSGDIVMLTQHAHITETPNTTLLYIGKTGVYRGSFNHFFRFVSFRFCLTIFESCRDGTTAFLGITSTIGR